MLDDEVEHVVAVASGQRFAEGGVEDAVMGVMRFKGGVVASFHDAFTIGGSPTGLEIHGTEGSLIGTEVLRQGPVGEVTLRRGDEVVPIDVGPRENLYVRGINRFTQAVHGDGRPVVTGEDGIQALAGHWPSPRPHGPGGASRCQHSDAIPGRILPAGD